MRLSRLGETEERFWRRVEKRGPNDCWTWTGTKLNTGYGLIKGELFGKPLSPSGSAVLAHRVSWMLANGPIPEGGPGAHGWVVMHTCDNRICVNPAHLVLGSQRANVADMDAKGRARRRGKIGCPPPNKVLLTDEQKAEISASLEPAWVLGKRFGCDKTVILKYRRSIMTPEQYKQFVADSYDRRKKRGAEVHNAKLTDDLVRQIRASKETNEAWAIRLGVSETSVAYARRGKTFAHVT